MQAVLTFNFFISWSQQFV